MKPITPWFLWPAVWLFGIAVVWFLVYELGAVFSGKYPTISALVIPNVRANLGWSLLLMGLFVGFIIFLIFDWFQLAR